MTKLDLRSQAQKDRDSLIDFTVTIAIATILFVLFVLFGI